MKMLILNTSSMVTCEMTNYTNKHYTMTNRFREFYVQ